MANKKSFLMGVDIGSTTIKSVIYDGSGNIKSIGRVETGDPEIVKEKDKKVACWIPDKIWKNVAQSIKQSLNNIDNNVTIEAVAVSAFGNDGGPIDKEGNIIYPFISWQYPGTSVELEDFLENIDSREVFFINGQMPWYASSVFRIMWIKKNRPEIYKNIHRWLLIQDYINFKLCNKDASDYTISSTTLLLDQKKKQWSKKIIEAAGINQEILPPLKQSGSFLGRVTMEASLDTGLSKGTQVIIGGHDNICGSLAAGGHHEDVLVDIGGTFESIILHSKQPVLSEEFFNSNLISEASVVKDMYAIYGFQYYSGCTEWIRSIMGDRDNQEFWDDFLKNVNTTKPGSNGLLFIPYLTGSNFPKDESVSGTLFGLRADTDKTMLTRSLIEGLNFLSKDLLNLLLKSTKKEMKSIRVIGGITYNKFWMQNKADILNMKIEVPEIPEATSLGLAILAGIGSGYYADLEDSMEKIKKPVRIFTPDERNNIIYSNIYNNIHVELYKTIKKINFDINKYIN